MRPRTVIHRLISFEQITLISVSSGICYFKIKLKSFMSCIVFGVYIYNYHYILLFIYILLYLYILYLIFLYVFLYCI